MKKRLSSKKQRRQDILMKIVRGSRIRTQDELCAALKEQAIEVNQSSLSRDITELGLIKQSGFYALPVTSNMVPAVTASHAGPYMLVLRTTPGMAPQVAFTLDNSKIRGIEGTIAGDDTVFIALSSAKASKDVFSGLEQFLTVRKKG